MAADQPKPAPVGRHYIRATQKNIRTSLVHDTQLGGITFVLGAGVSLSRGLRSWRSLTQSMWTRVLGKRPLPAWLDGPSATAPHPLAYAMVFEELEHALRAESLEQDAEVEGVDPIEAASDLFAKELAAELYQGFRDGPNPGDTLDVLARVLRQEQASPSRRVARVITFNADDLLETECNRGFAAERTPLAWPIARASNHPRRDPGANARPPIPIYHLHGFLPRGRNRRAAPDTLVFTDAQYWRSVASPGSFANRVLSNALQDSHCIFVGLSMEDVNLMRWLGLRQVEVEDDYRSRLGSGAIAPEKQVEKIRDSLNRHFWIATASMDPSRIIASHLERRGVSAVVLPQWGPPFEDLMRECFPPLGGGGAAMTAGL